MNPEIYEQVYVTSVYDQIAQEFDQTRHHLWPAVRNFISKIPHEPVIKIADIGCGNGRNMLLYPDNFIGLDISQTFVKICRQKGLNAHQGSILDIPFESNTFDYTICIAVIHHLSTSDRRLQAIRELVRITKPHGQILITVWSSKSQNNDQYHHKRLSESQPINNTTCDRLVDWIGHSGHSGQRYYHFFIQGELDELCHSIMGISLLTSYEEHVNYGIILQKN